MLLAFFYSICFSMVVSLLNQCFRWWYVFIIAAFIFMVLYKISVFKFSISFWKLDKKSIFYILILLGLTFLFQYLEKFVGGQDVRTSYLPYSRFIAENYRMPAFRDYWVNIDASDPIVFSYPPLVICWGAFLFQIFWIREWISSLVSLAFFGGFLVITYRWANKMKVNTLILTILLLISPFVIERLSWFHGDTPLLFGVTYLVYIIWQMEKNKTFDDVGLKGFMVLAIIMLSKPIGIFFGGFFIAYIFYRFRKEFFQKFYLILFIILPIILWYINNLIIFSNPFAPIFNFLTIDRDMKLMISDRLAVGDVNKAFLSLNTVLSLLMCPISILWLFIEFYLYKMERKLFFLICCISFIVYFLSIIIFTHVSCDLRYLLPFLGVAALRCTWGIQLILERFGGWRRLIFKGLPLILGVIAVFNVLFQFVYADWINKRHIIPYLKVMDFLNRTYKDKIVTPQRFFVDGDHGFLWYGRYFVANPNQLFFASDFLLAKNGIKDYMWLWDKYKIQFIANSYYNSPWEDNCFRAIDKDKKNYEKIFQEGTITVWKVKNLE